MMPIAAANSARSYSDWPPAQNVGSEKPRLSFMMLSTYEGSRNCCALQSSGIARSSSSLSGAMISLSGRGI